MAQRVHRHRVDVEEHDRHRAPRVHEHSPVAQRTERRKHHPVLGVEEPCWRPMRRPPLAVEHRDRRWHRRFVDVAMQEHGASVRHDERSVLAREVRAFDRGARARIDQRRLDRNRSAPSCLSSLPKLYAEKSSQNTIDAFPGPLAPGMRRSRSGWTFLSRRVGSVERQEGPERLLLITVR